MAAKHKPKEPQREAWDFSTCPTEELSFCVVYEYLRQVAMLHRKRLGKAWSRQIFGELFRSYFKDGQRVSFEGHVEGSPVSPFELNLAVRQAFAFAAADCEGFPDAPYLTLNPQERKQKIESFGLTNLRPDWPTMAQEDFFYICVEPTEIMRRYERHGLAFAQQTLEKEPVSRRKDGRWIVDYGGFQFELGLARINWSLSNKRLELAFKRWLETHRPEHVKIFETRGATQMHEVLKYLSATRLLTVFTADQALDYTQRLLGENPLYWETSDWYKAVEKANAVMRAISSPFIDWADEPKAGS